LVARHVSEGAWAIGGAICRRSSDARLVPEFFYRVTAARNGCEQVEKTVASAKTAHDGRETDENRGYG